jgi:hypothetical protein
MEQVETERMAALSVVKRNTQDVSKETRKTEEEITREIKK